MLAAEAGARTAGLPGEPPKSPPSCALLAPLGAAASTSQIALRRDGWVDVEVRGV